MQNDIVVRISVPSSEVQWVYGSFVDQQTMGDVSVECTECILSRSLYRFCVTIDMLLVSKKENEETSMAV